MQNVTHTTTTPVTFNAVSKWVSTHVKMAAQRRALRNMSLSLLSDIGVSEAQANTESHKHFWA